MWCRLSLVAGISIVGLSGGALAQEPGGQFFQGKQINLVVGSSPGGGYDIYARLLGRHLAKHVPGNPVVVVSNMPGAASNTAAAHIYNVAPKDGTVIGALQTSAVLDPLFGDAARAKHDASKFIYLGSATIDYYVCIARADATVTGLLGLAVAFAADPLSTSRTSPSSSRRRC